MILGLSVSSFTTVHVVLSLIGMASGAVVLLAMLAARPAAGWTALFLASTLLTIVTGFLFPISALTPALVVGTISLALLAAAILARYVYRARGPWRWVYVAGAVAALYLNVFVGVVQAFQKLSFLQPLAPTQSEPAFLATQLAVLALFVAAGVFAIIRFRPAAAAA